MSEQPRPCPLCGCGDLEQYGRSYAGGRVQSVIKCTQCGCDVRGIASAWDLGDPNKGIPDCRQRVLMLARGRVLEKWNRRVRQTCCVKTLREGSEAYVDEFKCGACGEEYFFQGKPEFCPWCGTMVIDDDCK